MDESFSDLTRNKLQTELLYAVKGLKGQVINQNSLSVGIDWKKMPQAIKKADTRNKKEQLTKICQEMAKCRLCRLAKTNTILFLAMVIPMRK